MGKLYDSVTQKFYNSEDEMKLAQNNEIKEDNTLIEKEPQNQIKQKTSGKIYNSETMKFEVNGEEVQNLNKNQNDISKSEFIPVKNVNRLEGIEDAPASKMDALGTLGKTIANEVFNFGSKATLAINNLYENGSTGDATKVLADFDKADTDLFDISKEETINIHKFKQGWDEIMDNSPKIKGALTEAGNLIDFTQGAVSGSLASIMSGSIEEGRKIFSKVAGDGTAELGQSTEGEELKRSLGDTLDRSGYHPVISALSIAAPSVIEAGTGFKIGTKSGELITKKMSPAILGWAAEQGGIKNVIEKVNNATDKKMFDDINNSMSIALKNEDHVRLLKMMKKDSDLVKAAQAEGIDLSTSTGILNKEVEAYVDSAINLAQERNITNMNMLEVNQLQDKIEKSFKTDAGALDITIKDFAKKELDDLKINYDALYDNVKNNVNKRDEVKNMTQTYNFLMEKKADFGKVLPKQYIKIKEAIWDKNTTPTYERLNEVRKQINDAIFNDKGDFSGFSDNILNEFKTVIDSDSRKFLKNQYGEDILADFDEAQSLFKKGADRKKVFTEILGKELNDSIDLTSNFNGLVNRGNINSFIKRFNNVPKEFKNEIVKSMISNSVIKGTKIDTNGFANLYSKIKDKEMMSVFKNNLSTEDFETFKNLGTVSTAIKRKNESPFKKSKSSTTESMDKTQSKGQKSVGKIGSLFQGAFIFPMIRLTGSGLQGVSQFMKTNMPKKAGELLSNKKFQRLLIEANTSENPLNKKSILKLEKEIEKLPEYKNFKDGLKSFMKPEFDKLVGLGLAGYITKDEKESDIFEDEDGTLNIRINK